MKSVFQRILINFNQYFRFAFLFYKLSSTIYIIFSAMMIYDVFYNFLSTDILLIFYIAFFISIVVENINFKALKITINNTIIHILVTIALSSLIYIFILNPINEFNIMYFFISFNVHYLYYGSLILLFAILFIIFNIPNNSFESFLVFIRFSVLFFVFFVFCLLLILVIYLSIDIIFNFSLITNNIINNIAISLCIIVYCFITLIFLGKMGSLNHFASPILESKTTKESEIEYYVFLILNIFSCIYSFLLLLYFIFQAIDSSFVNKFSSVIYLVLWFILFGIVLIWLNEGRNIANTKSNIKYKKLFLFILLIFSFIAFYSIFIRIYQYNFTPNRYVVLVISIFVIFSLIYMLFFKYKIKVILFTLFILLSFSVFMPKFNMITLSINSQLIELKALILNNQDASRIDSISRFLKIYNKDFDLDDYKKNLDSSAYSKDLENSSSKYLLESSKKKNPKIRPYYNDSFLKALDVNSFDIFLYFSGNFAGDASKIKFNNDVYKIELDKNIDSFFVYKNNSVILEIPQFQIYISKLDSKNNNLNHLDLSFEERKFRIYFYTIDYDNSYFNFYLLIKDKN